jgi:soluble lytic murein transglycosylase-like protein
MSDFADLIFKIVVLFMLGVILSYVDDAEADNPYKTDYIASAKAMEWKHDIQRGLLVAICEQESRWNPFAESSKGAVGLCQIMPTTFIDIIKQFQRDNELEVDGVIGPKTWGKMRPGVPFRWMSNRERLLDPFQSVEFAALYLKQIEQIAGGDPVLMMGIYYGGTGHHMVRYQREVKSRWESRL